MNIVFKTLLLMALAVVGQSGHGQSFSYVEAGVAGCPGSLASTTAEPKAVSPGIALSGQIYVSCGFNLGSYTVTLNSTDTDAAFVPKTFIVNFGRIVGNGAFSVRFATAGVQSLSATITSNMGSPAVQGHFVSADNRFKVLAR